MYQIGNDDEGDDFFFKFKSKPKLEDVINQKLRKTFQTTQFR